MVTARLDGQPRAATALASALAALLPAGFRERQRDEWIGDLVTMSRAGAGRRTRLRYLAGAALTLPSLRRQVRHGTPAAGDVPAPVAMLDTAARVLLYGMVWPVLSWAVWVPLRYWAADIPGRLAASDYTATIDPKDVWPMGSRFDEWLGPLWIIPHIGSWVLLAGGAILLGTVLVLGGLSVLLRKARPGWRLLLTLVAFTALVLGVTWPLGEAANYSSTAGMLGVLAVALGARTSDLGRRSRILLIVVGVCAIAATVIGMLPVGEHMIGWFRD